jgi:hypothetical protein
MKVSGLLAAALAALFLSSVAFATSHGERKSDAKPEDGGKPPVYEYVL